MNDVSWACLHLRLIYPQTLLVSVLTPCLVFAQA